MTEVFEPVDAHDRRLVLGATGLLAQFNEAGVLQAADVHVASRIGALAGERREEVHLALAMLVRAARNGSVCLEFESLEPPPEPLAWPSDWLALVADSPLVPAGVIRIDEGLAYLDRYWREEGAVSADLLSRGLRSAPSYGEARLADSLDALFVGETYAEQRAAAADSVARLTSVITGGPGTGKTTTLARLLALLVSVSDQPLRIGLAAPTGKAAARMTQAIADAAQHPDFPEAHRESLAGLTASTLHRLLGFKGLGTRFRHDRSNPLPHDVVVIDETSMVSLTQMARLIEAVRPDARLILVGDPDQLTSVEAGAVLKDLVAGMANRGAVSGLTRTFRFGDAIGTLASAIRDGDDDGVWTLLQSGVGGVELLDPADLSAIRASVLPPALGLLRAAEAGDVNAALQSVEAHRLLVAHREGPFGVGQWNRQIERWLLEATGRDWFPHWYAGQPLIVNSNDYGLKLWNGDTGVVVHSDDGLTAVFADGLAGRRLGLSRLADVDTAHAITVHRSQGSQFDEVTVLLPDVDSRTLTRELLYTAVTRAQSKVRVVATEESIRAAVTRPAQRATGLARRLAR